MSATDTNCGHCGAAFLNNEVALCPACSIAEVFSFADSSAKSTLTAELLGGKYLPGETLGEGGFGVVYRAEQVEPIRRPVAIKLLKPGADNRSITARFEAERQALALLDHPNIAKIYDAGETTDGRPFFAMELVDGAPITIHCEAENLPERERLELFATVCDAVAHAHERGIIHRDLKPSNVIVTEEGTPKVIDFGIAKATRTLLTEKTLLTGAGQFLGTPGYVSPEQAATSGRETDTRSDVYSLGALLYEMQSGQPPINADALREAGIEEILRVIREDDPPPTAMPRGLHHIVRQALEKDPDRRYSNAAELAADVRRYLNNEPVEARAPRKVYRLSKFICRHKAIAAMVIAGTGVAVLLATLYDSGTPQKDSFTTQRAQLGDTHPATLGALYARVDELEDEGDRQAAAALLFGDLDGTREPTITAAVLMTIGELYLRDGRMVEAERTLDRSLAMHREHFGNESQPVLDNLILLCELEAANYWVRQNARGPLFLEAVELARELHGDDSPITAQCVVRLGADYGYLLGLDATLTAHREAITRARASRAAPDVIEILESSLDKIEARRIATRSTAAKDYANYEQALAAGETVDAVAHLRNSAYRLGWAGDLDSAQERLAYALDLGARTELPFAIDNRNRVIEGWLAWRSGDRKRSIEIHSQLLEENLLSPELDSLARAQMLRNLRRPIWDSGNFDPYWEFIDRLEDRAASAQWPEEKTAVLLRRGSRWSHAPAPQSNQWSSGAASNIEKFWKRGHAPFSEYNVPAGCRLPPLQANTSVTHYFRTRFDIVDPKRFSQIKFRLSRWAGAAIYINGAEVARHNLVDAANSETLATVAEGGGQVRAHVIVIDPSALRPGENLIAVEIHRYARERYLFFDTQIEARLQD